MKKILFGIAISVFLASSLHAQTYGKWEVVPNPTGLFQGYTDMVFVTDTIGYISGVTQGSAYSIQQTTDMGMDFNSLTVPQRLTSATLIDMSWPTKNNGYVALDTLTPLGPSIVLLRTSNAGTSWQSDTLNSNLQISRIDFPNPVTGYAIGSAADGSGDFIAKTTDSGKTWKEIYSASSSNYTFVPTASTPMYFRDSQNGLVFAQNGNGMNLVAWTTDGGTNFNFSSLESDTMPNFLHWNNDSIWLAGTDSAVYRSIDSGKTWTPVVLFDAKAGGAVNGAFFDDSGFVFRSNGITEYMTTDFGATWTPGSLPLYSKDTLFPNSASMPSPYTAYLLATDNVQTDMQLEQIQFAKPVDTMKGGGGGDAVQDNPISSIPFSVTMEINAVQFSMQPIADSRTIEIMDVLGRSMMTLSLAPGSGSSQLPMNVLRPGTYFARLGESVLKFSIPAQ